MLQTLAPFPQVGSAAFLRLPLDADRSAEPEPVRILRRNPDGTALLSLSAKTYSHEAASGNRTVPLDQLVATRDEALPVYEDEAPKPRRRRPAR